MAVQRARSNRSKGHRFHPYRRDLECRRSRLLRRMLKLVVDSDYEETVIAALSCQAIQMAHHPGFLPDL